MNIIFNVKKYEELPNSNGNIKLGTLTIKKKLFFILSEKYLIGE